MNILITGGASGLGEAITRAAAEAFPDKIVYFTYCRSEQNALAIQSAYVNTKALKCDFRNQQDIDILRTLIESSQVDILVNNALSSLSQQYFYKTEPAALAKGFMENVLPVLSITRSFIARARINKSGKIITILSTYITGAPPTGLSAYAAEKNYLLAMHKSWVLENGAFNITSNCISPGFMNTPLNQNVDERIVEQMVAKHPLRKLVTVEEVADVALFLMRASSQVNGNNIIMNASLSI